MRTAPSSLARFGLAVAVIGALAGCSASSADPDCPATPAGDSSNSVKVSGDFGAKPTIDATTPLSPEATERTVVIAGDGETAVEGDTVAIDFTIINGTTGVDITATEYAEGSATDFEISEAVLPGITATLECSQVGSRVVGVIPAVDAFGDTGQSDLGIAAGDSLVFVADIVSIAEAPEPALPKADGEPQDLPAGFPDIQVTIADDADGTPTLVLPGGAAPTELQLAVLKKGEGAVVPTGADVVVNYQGIDWDTQAIFDQSWGTDGAPASPATFNTAQVIPGFTQALEGQTVGSQVLVVIPPALAYGEKSDSNSAALAGQTLVFIIDILGLA